MAISKITSDAIDATGFNLDSNTLTVDATNNRVGIGTSSPSAPLHVKSDTDNSTFVMEHTSPSTGTGQTSTFIDGNSNVSVAYDDEGTYKIGTSSNPVNGAGYSTAMTLDASGNLLVGKTSVGTGTAGVQMKSDGETAVTRSGTPFIVNRLSSDGTIVSFRKDGTEVGSISNNSTNFKVNGLNAVLFDHNGSTVVFVQGGGFFPWIDNTKDLGTGSLRFNDAFITNGVTTGSDQNDKQQIATLTDAEIAAAKRISNGFKTFKWNDAVEAKGDNARTHTGVIAQEVRTSLEAEGLDAGKYAFFMSDTWWETQTEVPAVEAVEAVDAVYEDVVIPAVEEQLDDEGNVIVEAQPERTEQRLVSEAVEAVEAQDAYTRTVTYDTADEAPEGATQRTRLGIRYPELLAFIGAATEQRLTHLETLEARIEVLENA